MIDDAPKKFASQEEYDAWLHSTVVKTRDAALQALAKVAEHDAIVQPYELQFLARNILAAEQFLNAKKESRVR